MQFHSLQSWRISCMAAMASAPDACTLRSIGKLQQECINTATRRRSALLATNNGGKGLAIACRQSAQIIQAHLCLLCSLRNSMLKSSATPLLALSPPPPPLSVWQLAHARWMHRIGRPTHRSAPRPCSGWGTRAIGPDHRPAVNGWAVAGYGGPACCAGWPRASRGTSGDAMRQRGWPGVACGGRGDAGRDDAAPWRTVDEAPGASGAGCCRAGGARARTAAARGGGGRKAGGGAGGGAAGEVTSGAGGSWAHSNRARAGRGAGLENRGPRRRTGPGAEKAGPGPGRSARPARPVR